jgi:4-hydroxy-tetrahydrodipicolinate reductase
MNIALVGYGKMGKAIEKIAIEHGHTITTIVNSANPIEQANFENVDVAIEFSIPQLALKHIHFFLDNNIPCVIGTTGWNAELSNITQKANELNSSFLYASNFSIGVNLFFKLNEQLAELMSAHPSYKVSMAEIHHIQKLDAPSGTAISLAQGIIENNSNYNKWFCPQGETNNVNNNGILIEAIREPDVPGTHSVNYSSTIDTITIHHEAHNRTGFATGAVVAAEWLIHKKGVFTMRDVLNIK